MPSMTCPRCGAENPVDAVNCKQCRINLRFAMENPAEVARLKAKDARRPHPEGSASAQVATALSTSQLIQSLLLLLGAFVFAFTLGEAVHELGHVLANRAYGTQVGVILDPFGGSHIVGGSAVPLHGRGVTAAAGPLLDLVAGLMVWLALWRTRRPLLLPLLLWGPLALVLEGVTFSLGMLTPGGDARWMVQSGIPGPLIVACGVLFLALGVAAVSSHLPLVGLAPEHSFGTKLVVVAGGMVSFMLLRLLVSSTSSPAAMQENLLPFVFSLLLAVLVTGLYGPVYRILPRRFQVRPVPATGYAAAISMALGLGMILFQLAFFN